MKLEQRIVVGAEVLRCTHPRDRLVEHTAKRGAVDISDIHTEAYNPSGELIHYDEHPMGIQEDGFAAKQVNGRQIRCALSTAAEDHQLVPEQKVLSHHGPGTARPEAGDAPDGPSVEDLL